MLRRIAGTNSERKSYLYFLLLSRRTDAAPCRSSLHPFRIARCKKHLQFVRFQTLCRSFVLGPKSKFPRGKTLLHQPESLAIVCETFYGCPPAVSKNEQTAGKRITLQYRFADSGKPIDAISEINSFHRHQDPHLRSNLNHRLPLQNVSLRAFRSGDPMPLRWIRILAPFLFSSSMMHSGVNPVATGLSSMNDGTGP